METNTFPNLYTVPQDRRHVYTDPERIEYVRAARYAAESMHEVQAGAVYRWDVSEASACRLPAMPIVYAEQNHLTDSVLGALRSKRDTDRALGVSNPFSIDPELTYAAKRLARLYLRAYRRGELATLSSPHLGIPWPVMGTR